LHAHARCSEPGALSWLGRRIRLIVFDEAHQAIAETYRRSVEAIATGGQPITPIVGLTATPGRTFLGSDADLQLAEFFHGNKVMLNTGAEGSDNPVRYLIEQEYLAEPTFEVLGELPEDPDAHGDEVSFGFEDDVALGMPKHDYLEATCGTALELIAEGHRRIIVFAATVDLSHAAAAVLRSLGVMADPIDGTTPSEIRDSVIRSYKAQTNTPRVLVNFGVLTTGFDAPQTSAVVIGRPTRSLVLYSQMVGRAIRGPKANGNRSAKIVTVVDPSVPAFGSIAAAFQNWEELW
ncbi:MAG: hypothetical protein M3198_02645, partial [Actinomycetota bacterium]|nr:hypothetical protein [Actinomycetota bacterium]